MLAALYAKRESLQELVRVGADIHMKDKWGKTALMYATSKGDIIAIQILLDAGANPHDTDWVRCLSSSRESKRNWVQEGLIPLLCL